MDLLLKLRMMYLLLFSGKISFIKILNFFRNQLFYFFKKTKFLHYPTILIVEPGNYCNLACISCRDKKNNIYDYFYEQKHQKIPQGTLDTDLYYRVLEEAKQSVLITSLYLHGEPLLNKDIFQMIKYATDRKVATLIATNGMMLNANYNQKLIDSGLDFVKIAISGFYQKTYEKLHQKGDIELIKNNIVDLTTKKKVNKSPLLIMVDYILFDYNRDEIELVQQFCQQLQVVCTVRIGHWPVGFKEGRPILKKKKSGPSDKLCKWPWHIAVLNWNGQVLPCTKTAISSSPIVLGDLNHRSLHQIWDGPEYNDFRAQHVQKGRKSFHICQKCHWDSIGFQQEEERK